MNLASIKLDSINKTVSGLTEAVKKANLIASDIGKKVREANVRLRERISNANKDYQKRLDSSRKKTERGINRSTWNWWCHAKDRSGN